jgi:hypothetical protein
MIGFTDAPEAWGLTQGMARVVGISLPSAVIDGWLTRAELARLVGRCQICDQSPRCLRWLSVPRRDVALPDYCPNKPEIEALAPL